MNWLDNYIRKNETGYLMNDNGGLFVSLGDGEYIRHACGDDDDFCDIREITKDEFVSELVRKVMD